MRKQIARPAGSTSRSKQRSSFPVICLMAAVLCSCDSVFGGDGPSERLGTIEFYRDPIVIEVPATVERGEDFRVSIRTYGGGCITRGPTRVERDDLRATVSPYDIQSGAQVCTDELRLFDHEATLRFDRTGQATIIFRGMKRPDDTIITEERSVVVE